MANKTSIYIQSLVDFVLDTKPYHSKLTEVVQEYRFFDEMTVRIDEQLFSNTILKGAWTYPFFSRGISSLANPPQLRINQLEIPQFTPIAFTVQEDENLDLPFVPFAYDPRCLAGPGASGVFLNRANGVNEPLLEGHDFYLSHGAYVFNVKDIKARRQTAFFENTYTSADGPFPITVNLPGFGAVDFLAIFGPAVEVTTASVRVLTPGQIKIYGIVSDPLIYGPTFTERANENLFTTVTALTRSNALNVSNPNSAISKIKIVLDAIAAQLVITPNANAFVELEAIRDTINIPALPSTYEALLNWLDTGTPVISGYTSWKTGTTSVEEMLSSYSPSMYFNNYTDIGSREDGALAYTFPPGVTLQNFTIDPLRAEYEEFTFVAFNNFYQVSGSQSGLIGSTNNGAFSSPQISFTGIVGTPPAEFVLTPKAKITIHADADPTEIWSLIKVNPKAYSRPVFSSVRYGFLADLDGIQNYITINDPAFPTSTVVIQYLSATEFTVSYQEPGGPLVYIGIATVSTVGATALFTQGGLAFTINAGSTYAFQAGDVFNVNVFNEPPQIQNLDLYYGYDVDPYDEDIMVYNDVSSALDDYLIPLDFGFDSRFATYDLLSFGLQLGAGAVDGRQWRLRALPSIRGLELQGDNIVRINGIPVIPEMTLWYADEFELEYLDAGVWVSADPAPIAVGTVYTNSVHGISFNLVPGAKPFIASKTDLSTSPIPFDGGDVISWTVRNINPAQIAPANFVSRGLPYLFIHGDSFYDSRPAIWQLSFTSANTYSLRGIQNTVIIEDSVVNMTADGFSFKNGDVHYTVMPGTGFAAGDSFIFETYANKPSYLVYGSSSGWQADAEYDKWYWNGKIGFKLKSAGITTFEKDQGSPNQGPSNWHLIINDNGLFVTSIGNITLQSLRKDTPKCIYELRGHAGATQPHWSLWKDGSVVGHGYSTIGDKYIKLNVPLPVPGAIVKFVIDEDDRTLTQGHDLVIIRSSDRPMPVAGDSVMIEKTKADSLQISIKALDSAHSIALGPLTRVDADFRAYDHNANSGVPLSNTSPETAVLTGWIPLVQTYYDGNSIAEFSDRVQRVDVHAAGTGELIGTVAPNGAPAILTWDHNFAQRYLPLNAETTIVTLGSGTNESVSVNMREGIFFLTRPGGLQTDVTFSDNLEVRVVENNQWLINANYSSNFDVQVQDGPFGGFLPGYDNVPFDGELASRIYQNIFFATDPSEEPIPASALVAGLPYYIVDAGTSNFNPLDDDNRPGILFTSTGPIPGNGTVRTPVVYPIVITFPFFSPSSTDDGRYADIGYVDDGYLVLEALTIEGPAIQSGSNSITITGPGLVKAYPSNYTNSTHIDAYYDAGIVLTDYVERAQSLAYVLSNPLAFNSALMAFNQLRVALSQLTEQEFREKLENERNDLVNLIGIAGPNPINYSPTADFGIPYLGMGMSIDEKPEGSAGAAMQETTVIVSIDNPTGYDVTLYGVDGYDRVSESVAQIIGLATPGSFISANAQVQAAIASAGVNPEFAFGLYETPFSLQKGGRVIDFVFLHAQPPTLEFRLWYPANLTPNSNASYVQRITDKVFRLSLPTPMEIKFVVNI